MKHEFEPEEIREVVGNHLDRPLSERLRGIRDELAARHPGLVHADSPWLFNNAGGAMGAMQVLYATPREYVLIFGTPVGTDGHSGRFPAKDWLTIVDGEHWSYAPGDLEPTVLGPGEQAHLPPGEVHGYRMPGCCWAVEYARGFIPGMLPFGLADTLTSTLDVPTLARTLGTFTRMSLSRLAPRRRGTPER